MANHSFLYSEKKKLSHTYYMANMLLGTGGTTATKPDRDPAFKWLRVSLERQTLSK